jgi:hypothetical protein
VAWSNAIRRRSILAETRCASAQFPISSGGEIEGYQYSQAFARQPERSRSGA